MNGDQRRALLAQADAYFTAGRMEDALRVAGQCLIDAPGEVEASWVAILALIELGDTTQAVRLAAQATTVHPDHSDAWRLLAMALSADGNSVEAVAAADRAVQLDPDGWWVHETACRILLESGRRNDRKRALVEAALAMQLAPEQPNAHLSYGDALRARGRFRRAETAYQEALRLDPGNLLARERLGLLELDQGMSLNAYRAFVPLVAQNPADHVIRGHAHLAVWLFASEITTVLTIWAWCCAFFSSLGAVAAGHDGGVMGMLMVFMGVLSFMLISVYIVRYRPESRLLAILWSQHRCWVLAAAGGLVVPVIGLAFWFWGLVWVGASVMVAGAIGVTICWSVGRRNAGR